MLDEEDEDVSFDLASIGAGLPFAAALPDLAAALPGGAVVVQAPPGTGKTTLVPPAVANWVAQSGAAGRVVVTGPRRVVVRAAARRLAQLTGTRLGELVGFTVRGESVLRRSAAVEFVTAGVLLRRLLNDPGLDGVAAVVLDEVHERAIETDLLIGMLAQVRELRDDLDLLAMSATLDAAQFAGLLGEARVITCPARQFPLVVDYRPGPTPTDARGVTGAFLDHVATVVESAAREAVSDDVLVFLPGAREVSRVSKALAERLPERDVLVLTGRVSSREQDRVVSGRGAGERARVVVSTALAESALTVPGVRAVVDAGLSREPRLDRRRDMQGLITITESRAAAEQRAGRAAREAPGRVIRCFPEAQFERMARFATPSIATADLTDTALLLAAWGTPGGVGLALPTPPPDASIKQAHDRLLELGALTRTSDGVRITELGRALAGMPVDPRLGRALLAGAPLVGRERACESVAFIAEELPGGDLRAGFASLRGAGSPAARRWREQARRLAGFVADLPGVGAVDGVREADALGVVSALAYPGRIARLAGDSYLLASGTRVGGSADGHEWIVAVEVTRSSAQAAGATGALLRSFVPITERLARTAGDHLLREEKLVSVVDRALLGRRRTRLGAITLSDTPVRPDPGLAREAIEAAIVRDGLGALVDDDSELRRRLAVLQRVLGDPWPDVSDSALVSDLYWLRTEIDSFAMGKAPQLTLDNGLRNLLPWPAATRLDELVPTRLAVPSGNTARIDYPEVGVDSAPVVAVKLQECFGLAETPRLVDGRLGVVFHLLSPAGRPLAVTDDLASFWDGPYRQVRAEMRGRYPKHPWPEDPWAAPATARTNRRSSR